MASHSLILAIIYFSFNHKLILMTMVTSTPLYVPTENIPLNCGSPDDLPGADGRRWIADHDKDSRYSLVEGQIKSNIFAAAGSRGSIETVPYMTARVSRSQFTYSFRVTPGPKFIRLHFHPSRYRDRHDFDPSKAFFTVKAGNFTLLRNFSAYLITESLKRKAFMREFGINVEENVEKLDITFFPSTSSSSTSYVFVNGIEIVSMPTTLIYYTWYADEIPPPNIGQQCEYCYENYAGQALQTVYRLNVGGSDITPMEDTGMYREWTQDDPYFMSHGFVPIHTSKRLNYSKISYYSAPDEVYRTAIAKGKNSSSYLIWRLPVDSGFNYLVRLHFCTFGQSSYKADLALGDKADLAFSTIDESDGISDIPIYNDYTVNVVDKNYLFVFMSPKESYTDAILNGMEVFKFSSDDGNLAGPNPQLLANPGKSRKTILAIAIGSGVAGFLVLLSMVCCASLRLRKEKLHHRSAMRLPENLCHRFTLSKIKTATNNFDQALVIGRGGFGKVYKGHIDEEFPAVAIKRLNKGLSSQGEREFEAEIKMLSQLRHVHLVSLIGYCDDNDEMILVYDYMANGTLKDHLYGANNDPLLWKQRLEICMGAARGLHYLHSEVKNTIIHRDVKTANILLDKNWVAKVADFGLSKLGQGDSAVSTAVKGTFGYLDPEYARSRKLTNKSDVYAFGVVLFEVLCARKPVDIKLEEDQQSLALWARRCVREGKIQDIIDPYLDGKIAPECLKNFMEVAYKCVRDHQDRRPMMRDVVEKLEFSLDLQQQADAARQGINPDGVYGYDLELPFNWLMGPGLEGGTGFATPVDSGATGLSSLDTDCKWHSGRTIT